jgi:hypothetical protein
MESLVFAEEYVRAGAPSRAGIFGEGLLGPTLVHFGTDAQKDRFLGPILRGEEFWCQGFSEPGAGSDLAGLSTKARLDGDRWVIDGQKVWTTLAHLSRYPELSRDGQLDFLQNKVPKLLADTLEPLVWPASPEMEWCPPGHGDLYPSLLASGWLDRLAGEGIEYLFVSNSDNLGATVDLDLLGYFAGSGLSFLMEVAERTPSDRKGGHLARRKSDGRLVLREVAQCPAGDLAAFQDITLHRF